MTEKNLGITTSISIEDVKSGIQEVMNLFKDIPDKISTEIGIDYDKSILTTVKDDLEDLENFKAEPKIDVDDSESKSVIDEIKSELEVINGDTVQATISAEDDASSVVEAIKSTLDDVEGITTIVLTGEDDASGVIDQVKAELDSLPTSVNIAIEADTIGIEDVTNSTDGLTQSLSGAAAGATAYKFGMEGLTFENYIGQSVAFTNATAEQRSEMEKTVKENSSAKYPVNDLSSAYLYLSKQTGDSTTATNLFGTELSYIKQNSADLTGGITGLTKLYQLYDLNTTEAASATAVLNGEILGTGYSGDQFLQLVQRSSLDLKNMGFSLEETGAIVSSFGRSGVDAASAQRMLRGGFNEFIKEFDEGNPKLGEYEEKIQKAGVATRDANGNLRPAKEVLSDLMSAFAKMPEGPEKTQLAMELFGTSAGKVMGNLKVDYKDIEKEASTSAQGQIKAAQDVRKGTQDPLKWVMNELTKLTTGWGTAASQIMSWAGLLATFWASYKFGDWVTKGALSDFKTKFMERLGLDEISTNIKEKLGKIGEDLKTKIAELKEKVFGGDKAKFEISIVEDEKGNTVIEEAKINSFVERIKLKIAELKESNIYKMIFGDEKGTVSLEEPANKIAGFIEGVKAKVDELKNYNIWDKISGIDSGESRAKASESNVGGMIDRIKGKIDELKNYNIYDRISGKTEPKTEITLPKGEAGTGESGGMIDSIKTWFKGLNLKGLGVQLLSDPELFPMILGTYFGEQNLEEKRGEYDKYKQGLPYDKDKLTQADIEQFQQSEGVKKWQEQNPEGRNAQQPWSWEGIKQNIDGFQRWIGGLPGWIVDLFFPKAASAAEPYGSNKKSKGKFTDELGGDWTVFNQRIQEMKDKITGFKDWLLNLKFPNILDIIFPKPVSGAGGDNEKGPLEKWVEDTKGKIMGFLQWLGTLNPLSIIDILMGKKPGQKEGEKDQKDPVTVFVDGIKDKINKFFEWIGTLNPLSLIDILMGKKPGQKEGDQKDPITSFIEGVKDKINKFFEWLGTLNPLTIIDIIMGKKSGQKEGEKDPLTIFIDGAKDKVNKFFEWLGTLNPLSIIDMILGRKKDQKPEDDGFVKWINDTKKNIGDFLAWLGSLGSKFYEVGKSLIDNFVKGMQEAYNLLPPVLQKIADNLFKSPAKEGPLSQITETGFMDYGRAVIRAFSSGIYNELNESLLPVLKEGSWMIGQFNMASRGFGTLDIPGNNTEYNRPLTLPGTTGGSEWSNWNPLNIDWSVPMTQAIDFTQSFGNMFPASPPKTGALSKITSEGASSWMSSIMGGMSSAVKSGIASLNSELGGLTVNQAISKASSLSNQYGAGNSKVSDIINSVSGSAGSSLLRSASSLDNSADNLTKAGNALLKGVSGSSGRSTLNSVQVNVSPGAVLMGESSGSAGKSELRSARSVPGAGAVLGRVISQSIKNNIKIERW